MIAAAIVIAAPVPVMIQSAVEKRGHSGFQRTGRDGLSRSGG
jgi:hypothetical protein